MTELQIWLAASGATIVVAVVAYNKWVEWRAMKQAREAFGQTGDALLTPTSPREVRVEPSIDVAIEPSPFVDDAALPTVAAEPVEFDDEIECIVSLSFDTPVEGGRLHEALAGLRAGTKPVRIGGTHAQSHALEVLRIGEGYSGVHCGVLLANRGGPLTPVEFSEFATAIGAIAHTLEAHIELPDMADVLSHARDLDSQCAAIDAQIGVNLVSTGAAWGGLDILRVATEAGFSVRPDGRLLYIEGVHDELFSMHALDAQGRLVSLAGAGGEASSGVLTCVLDVPRAPEVAKPFSTMIDVARAVGARLGAELVDDNRRTVTDAALAGIEVQLAPLYQRLRDSGIEPGSARARRLFD
ncbi:cell division protein ZipA C-terminal FtsZ-binding domain-containing protein [Derxia lacustris]|uniref:cell division protein ZipA C-terminal FtsZ-binding domain-containing protein n=1 Tax=Derxia lacustris TaxID=764842 RepID=UPI000A16EF8E|nr:cell division protein ZipA C-terminal FtsZ-binding domain-containing protein [Derxia lacustris]